MLMWFRLFKKTDQECSKILPTRNVILLENHALIAMPILKHVH